MPHKRGFLNVDGAKIYLIAQGQKDDKDIDLIEAGFAFSLLEKPSVDLQKYRNHIDELSDGLKTKFDELAAKENSDSATVQVMALAKIFSDQYAYLGDDIHYDDLKNINLFDVIDRRLGMPITLCMIAIAVCRAQGWQADGINFPGHFLMRLEKDGERLIIDPFQGCKILEAKDLRLILKRVTGDKSELSAEYYNPCLNREILLRLQNNMKYRLIDAENYNHALDIVETMVWVAPDDYRLCLDKAVLLARCEQPKAAIENLLIYIDSVQDPVDRRDAQEFLQQLQKQLN